MKMSKLKFAAVLAVALVAAPSYSALAQDASTALHAEKKQLHAEEKEADSTDVYRHSASVRWIANTLHTDLETTAKGMEVVNFLILILCVIIPISRVLPKVLKQRRATLSAGLEAAKKATEDAGSRLGAVEARLATLDSEIAALRKQVEQEIAQDEARVKASIEQERQRIVAASEQEIQSASANAQRELRRFAAGLAIDQAAQRINLTAEEDSRLISSFHVGQTANGGRN